MTRLIVPGVAMDPSQSEVGGRREAGEQGAGGHPHQRGGDGAQCLMFLSEVSKYSPDTTTPTTTIITRLKLVIALLLLCYYCQIHTF